MQRLIGCKDPVGTVPEEEFNYGCGDFYSTDPLGCGWALDVPKIHYECFAVKKNSSVLGAGRIPEYL